MTELYQIYYEEKQKESIFPFAVPYYNENLTHFFENSVIARLVLASGADRVAVCSWKLKEKLRQNVKRPRPLTKEVLDTDYEVLSFTGNTKYHQMLAAAENWHKGFREILSKILNFIGIPVPSEVKDPIYQNHFSACRSIYQDYVKTYLIPAMGVMDNVKEIYDLCWQDSNYSTLTRGDSSFLKDKIGVPYYPMHPFILERLFSIYVHNKKIRVTWL